MKMHNGMLGKSAKLAVLRNVSAAILIGLVNALAQQIVLVCRMKQGNKPVARGVT